MAKYRFELLNRGLSSYSLSPKEFVKKSANDIPREIRYIPSSKELFVDEQDKRYEKHKGESVEFPDRGFYELDDTVPSNRLLIQRLQLSPRNEKNSRIYPSVKPMFREIEINAAAEKEVRDVTEMLDILNSVVILNEADLRRTAFLCGVLHLGNMNTEELSVVRAKLVKYTQSNHVAVSEIIKDSLKDEKDLIIEALSLGILNSENEKMSIITHDSGTLFVKNLVGENALKDGAILLSKDDAKRKALKIKVSQAKNGTSSFDEEKQALAERVEVAMKVSDFTYPQLVEYACKLVDDKKPHPFVNSGSSYYLSGYEDIILRYKDEEGNVKNGKAGLRMFLDANEDIMKTPLSIAMSAFL